MRRTVVFPDGTRVQGSSLDGCVVDDPERDFGLYLDKAWAPTWPATVLDWADSGLPADYIGARDAIRSAFARAKCGQRVEVGCIGGLGRTGTVLACMATMAGVLPEAAVSWVRLNYHPGAIEEGTGQEDWVLQFGKVDPWCVFRNLVHTVYREIRHFGPDGDLEARCTVANGPFLSAAGLCQKNRRSLEGTALYREVESASRVQDVLDPYVSKTGLNPREVRQIFAEFPWKARYGGSRWAGITESLIDLAAALEAGDSRQVQTTAQSVFGLSHNSGLLVPARDEWLRISWLQEKWPLLCD